MQTISVMVLGPTDTRGRRVKATPSGGGRPVTLPWDDNIGDDWNFMRAAEQVMHLMAWDGEMVGGHTKDGMVFVFTEGTRIKARRAS